MKRRLACAAAAALVFGTIALGSCSDDGGSTQSPTTSTGAGGGLPTGITIEGLSATVDVVYDQFGIVHLTCQTDADCFAAMGYAHAANRFFFMHFVRLAMRGQLSSVVDGGDASLQSDLFYRQFFSTRDGQPLEEAVVESLPDDVLGPLERYATGVNAWLADAQAERNEATFTNEFYLVSTDIRPWEPEDTVAVAFYLMENLGSTVEDELRYGEMVAALSPELAADLLMVRPPFADFTTTSAGGTYGTQSMSPKSLPPTMRAMADRLGPARPLLRRARQRLAGLWSKQGDRSPATRGSNNWVVGPGLTTGGNALLANDPHLQLLNPSIFMPMELDSKSSGSGTLHVAGGSVAALPVILSGHTEDVAWGVTTIVYDLNEVYVEEINDDGTQVMFEGSWVPITTREVTIATVDEPVTQTMKWVPHHGPIIEEDLQNNSAISVRWVPYEGVTDIGAFLALNRASSVSEVGTAVSAITAADQNFVAIDREGNIGWYPMGKVPNRPWASLTMPAWAPVPGDGTAEWDGFVDTADLPQLYNPPNQFIATANQDITGASADGDPFDDGHPVLQSWDTAYGARMHRIVTMLEAKSGAHDVDSMLAIQRNVRSSIADAMLPSLLTELAGLSLSTEAARVRTALEAWQHTCPTGLDGTTPDSPKNDDATQAQESIGCTAFHTLLYTILDQMLDDEEEEAEVTFFFRSRLNLLITDLTEPSVLASAGSYWDDLSTGAVETRLDILTASIEAAGTLLDGRSSDPDDWRWGSIHTVTLESLVSPFGIPTFDEGPFANDGALSTVDVASPRGAPATMSQTHGATIRTVIEATPSGMQMKFQTAGGTSQDPESPFYLQLFERYLRNQPVDFPFGPGAVPNPRLRQYFMPPD
ncbi:MAG: penicillin acylase family protein [Deltaproteobacteria bacterium]|nr:penicillin acylase family protein [Deltaproteobacteria bacterium]MBW2535289.1 penicillin acylase family protein [Deltaproteobacteria bacterium]